MRLRVLATACLLVCAAPAVLAAPAACSAVSGAQQLPLVELYTSEGCSDCPPADKWLSRLAQDEKAGMAALAFHVDYWDNIGWVDRFGLPLNTQRQKARIGWAKSKALVTPSVMIGEKVMVKWRSPAAVDELLSKARTSAAPVGLSLNASLDGGQVRVDFQADPKAAIAGPAYLWLALYQDGLSTAVRAGENKNQMLKHDRVVRVLKGPWQLGAKPVAGDAVLALPEDAVRERMGLVLFAESGTNGAGLQAVQLPLSGCGASGS